MNKKFKMNKSLKLSLLLICCIAFLIFFILFYSPEKAKASAEGSEIDYKFEDVPVESIEIKTDPDISEIKPGESFSVSFELSPWYTTVDRIYFDIMPIETAVVSYIDTIKIENGQALGSAIISVSSKAEVGTDFSVTASANGIESNKIGLTVAKIPVEQIKLSFADSDDKLHIGKSKQVSCEIFPQTATNKNIRYELSGTGAQYVKDIDQSTGTVTAVSDVSDVKADSTIVVTAFSEDDPSVSDSIVMSLYVPTIDVELSASTPLGGKTSDNVTLAVANSVVGETVKLSATVNGVNTTGLNYVIVKGREYIEDGLIRSDGSFSVKSISEWTANMCQPHAEIRIRAAYSDGFDEIGISIYVPVEKISFVGDDVPEDVENYRTYDLSVQAFPKYATFLNDHADPFVYSLNGLDNSIAAINNEGILTLPKSLTSKGSVINYSAYLNGAWEGVDIDPLVHTMSVVPVIANDITNIVIKKNGVPITDRSVKVMPEDNLDVEVDFDKDNVTEVNFDLLVNSGMLSVSNEEITISELSAMTEDNPYIQVTLKYKGEISDIFKQLYIPIYVPAETANIQQVPFERDKALNLTPLVTINGHGYASDKTITWGSVKIDGINVSNAECINGMLSIDSKTNAGSKVTVEYKICDNDNWFEQEFIVAPLKNHFGLSYTKTQGYTINPDAPQLEEGQSVGLLLDYNGLSGKNFGLKYILHSTANSTISEKTNNSNNGYDEFTLSARSDESGRNNYIEYLIEIHDGEATYYIGTQYYGKISPAGTYMKNISIFNRISGNISVSNKLIENSEIFELSNWDKFATFDEDNLSWYINGNTITNKTLEYVEGKQFILKISASQPYNGSYITFSVEIVFIPIIYKNESDDILKITYKKNGETIYLENSLNEGKENYAQTGWSTEVNGEKDYDLCCEYSENTNLILYPYWNKIVISELKDSAFETKKFLNESFCDWQVVDNITDCFNNYTSIDNLKKAGFKKATVTIDMHIKAFGNVEMYLQIYDVASGKELCNSDLYRSPNGENFDKTYTFTFDISDIDNSHEIQMRFEGRRYSTFWGGGVTLTNRNYTVTYE